MLVLPWELQGQTMPNHFERQRQTTFAPHMWLKHFYTFLRSLCGFVRGTPIEWHCHYNNWKRLQMFAFPAHWWNQQIKAGFQHRNYNIGGKYQMWASNCNLLKLLALLWGRSVFSTGQRQSLQVSLPQHVMTKSWIGGSAIPFFYRKGWKKQEISRPNHPYALTFDPHGVVSTLGTHQIQSIFPSETSDLSSFYHVVV